MIKILAKPKHGISNLILDRLYNEIGKSEEFKVIEWTPARMLLLRYQILHIHWPENILNSKRRIMVIFKFVSLFLALGWIRLFGRKIIWTAHNRKSHGNLYPEMEKWFWAILFRMLDGVIFLKTPNFDRKTARDDKLQSIKQTVIPHGSYCGIYPDEVSRSGAREWLGVRNEAKVILALGLVRRYKKLQKLLEIAKVCPEIDVFIAGASEDHEYQKELKHLAYGVNNAHIRFEFVQDSDLQYYLRGSDLFVFSCAQITNSGSAILALSYDLPVLAPDLECFVELNRRFGEKWVQLYQGELSAPIIAKAIQSITQLKRSQSVEWGDWSWESIGDSTCEFYKRVLGKQYSTTCQDN